ncbi:hypothetical protein AWB78_04468 [Caballeronia calidae]|uniref:Uncharacterized protein n=2 Tax=Caballeronia calidae TaxID=1777139 RepID=A0A158CWJ3_9BURK|nr:hypothetical protein AWB78_04468 [Caballeronia calidae]
MQVCGVTKMKMAHRLKSSTAGPVWGLALGILLTVAGAALWWSGDPSFSESRWDRSAAVAALLAGVFLVVCAGRELHRHHK